MKNILQANDRMAELNHQLFAEKKILAINMMSSPGAGKTTLIVNTIHALNKKYKIAVIEGDLQSTYDADKIAETGALVVQINTEGGCHLDGNMIRATFEQFDLNQIDLLIIENVGNLVCPAEFNLGEDFKVMLLSVPEGDDKPLKYPYMFHESKVLLINKTDLLPYVDCDVEKIRNQTHKINPEMEIFEISSKSGAGLDSWYKWLQGKIDAKNNAAI